jgi:acetylornithine deacetylase
MASAYWAIRILMEMGFKPAGDILFESVVDEEYAGGNGTLAARLKGYNADLGILTEPTRMEVCPAALGAFLGNITLKGKAGVPYTGSQITNPVTGIARVVQLFMEWEDRWQRDNSHPLFKGKNKLLKVLLWRLSTGSEGEFVQLGAPQLARLSWIVWCYPGMGEEEFYRRFRGYWDEAIREEGLKHFEIELKPEYHFVRPWETNLSSDAVQAVIKAWEDYTGESPSVGGASFSCDLAIYGDVGRFPCVIIGPRGDNLHAPDEWVLVEDIYSLTGIFATIISQWCG